MIDVREGISIESSGDVRVYLPKSAINYSDRKEFVANDRFEAATAKKEPGRVIFDDIAFKADFIRTFEQIKSRLDIYPGHNVLELGANHGWASVIAKDDCPEAYVVASDLVPDCIHHAARYEGIFGRKLDEKWAFSVRDIPFKDAQFDRIFTFASFHHFGDHGDYEHSMAEITRILKAGGKLVLLYEPATPAFLYKRAYKRVNRVREHEGLDEDVLVESKLRPLAEKNGMWLHVELFPYFNYRSSVASSVYYYLMAKLKLSRWLVCTANMVMRKR
jgi:SAM-dependent methyltransferase